MFEDHSHRLGHARAETERRHNDADRAQIGKAREAADALFAPKRETAPPAKSPAAERESPGGQGPRKPRILRALSQPPAQEEPPAKPVKRKPRAAAAPAEEPKPTQISASHLPRIRSWLTYGMTVPQVAELYGVPTAAVTRLLQES